MQQKRAAAITGDIFTSAFLAAMLNYRTIGESLQIAVDHVNRCILRTKLHYPYMTYGVNFEAELPSLIKELGLK